MGMMTDRPSKHGRPVPSARQRTPSPSEGSRSAPGSAPTRTQPLLGAFPLTVMTIATFLVLFAFMMGRLKVGADLAVRGGTGSSLVLGSSGSGFVTTRTSGAGAASALATRAVAPEASSGRTPAIVTRASGALGATEVGDE